MPEDEHGNCEDDADKHAGRFDDVQLASEDLYSILKVHPGNIEAEPNRISVRMSRENEIWDGRVA